MKVIARPDRVMTSLLLPANVTVPVVACMRVVCNARVYGAFGTAANAGVAKPAADIIVTNPSANVVVRIILMASSFIRPVQQCRVNEPITSKEPEPTMKHG